MQRKRKKNGMCRLQSTAVMQSEPPKRRMLSFHASVAPPPGTAYAGNASATGPSIFVQIGPPRIRGQRALRPMPATITGEDPVSSFTRRTAPQTISRWRSQNASATCRAPASPISSRSAQTTRASRRKDASSVFSFLVRRVAGIFLGSYMAEHKVGIRTCAKYSVLTGLQSRQRSTEERSVATLVRSIPV